MTINGLSQQISKAVHAIPGANLQEKGYLIAKETLRVATCFALFRYIPPKMQPYCIYLPFLEKLVLIPYINDFAIATGIAAYGHQYQRYVKTVDKTASFSMCVLFLATTYATYDAGAYYFKLLIFQNKNEKIVYNLNKIDQQREIEADWTKTALDTLDDCNFTMGDYFILDGRFPYDERAPLDLKERVAFHLKNKGFEYGHDLIGYGIVDASRDRFQVFKNLHRALSGDTSSLDKTDSLPEISSTSRFYSKCFNLILTGSVLAVQLRCSFKTTVAGLALGFLSGDLSPYYAHKQSCDKRNTHTNYSMFLFENRRHFEGQFFPFRKEKTAWNAPSTTAQKLRQIWEAWYVSSLTIYGSYSVSINSAIGQGQTLADYWRSFRADKASPAPRENGLPPPGHGPTQDQAARLLKLYESRRAYSAAGFAVRLNGSNYTDTHK
jgi:hypothetical protein